LGALTLGAWWASGGPIPNWSQTDRRKRLILSLALFGTLMVGASGAIIALGDTLFPPATLTEGLQQKFDPNAHIAVRLRMLHPALALTVAAYLAVMAIHFTRPGQGEQTRFWGKILLGMFILQLALGGINVLLLAPVWMQLVHLLVSDLIWMVLIILSNTALTEEAPVLEAVALRHPVGADS
jgi:heme A synthase